MNHCTIYLFMFFRPKSFKIFENLSSLKNVNYPLLNLKIQNNSLKYCYFFLSFPDVSFVLSFHSFFILSLTFFPLRPLYCKTFLVPG